MVHSATALALSQDESILPHFGDDRSEKKAYSYSRNSGLMIQI